MLEQKVLSVTQEQMAQMVPLEKKVSLEQLEKPESLERKENKEDKECLDFQVPQEHEENVDQPALSV